MVQAVRLTATWVLPIDAPPIRDGAVLVASDGRIAAVGTAADVPNPLTTLSHEFPHGILAPGFINTHTHLELTGLEGTVPDRSFPDWIRTLRQRKATRDPTAFRDAAREGLRRSFASGVTTIADTGDSGATVDVLGELGGAGIYYQEVFGPHPDQAQESLADLVQTMKGLDRRGSSPRIRLGVSPHAPYSVSGPLYQAVGQYARELGWPIAVHLAESQAETDLVTRGKGHFADAWAARGIPPLADVSHGGGDRSTRSPVAWVDHHGVLGSTTLCIHAIAIDAADIALLARTDASVAHCPRSNLYHHDHTAPLTSLQAAGVRVGIGTDSEASVSPADIRMDARLAASTAGLAAEDAVRMLTMDGAHALDDSTVGNLAPGQWGDVVVVSGGECSDPYAGLLRKESRVLATWIGGRAVYPIP